MTDIIDISTLHKNFKSDVEKQQFMEKCTSTILDLQKLNNELKREIDQLKSQFNTLNNGEVTKIILTPEEALIEDQILMIQQRSYGQELSLEDVKKLDILLRGKKLIKEDKKTIEAKHSKPMLSNDDLMKIAQNVTS